MPKQKTHSGLKKRVKITASGKIVRGHAYTGHLKTNKSHKQNKDLSKTALVHSTDEKRIKSLISNLK
ncbi:MAG: 50S ribosomal protein L35 [Acholeplasmatales bacterium]|jgi:large subunit ribosomal protein L35|nr:50S ribosomal protein L35 [Acholeplasmatales bacterium]